LVKAALAEDIGRSDLTSLAAGTGVRSQARIVAKGEGVLSGTISARMVWRIGDSADHARFVLRTAIDCLRCDYRDF